FYYLCRQVAGDFQATVTEQTRVTATDPFAHTGLMARESLDVSARNAFLHLMASHGLLFKWRPAAGGPTDGQAALTDDQTRLPMLMRLTRRRSTIAAEYSIDAGRSFQPAGTPTTFDPPLPETVWVGLAITAHDPSQITQAKFRDLQIEPLGR